MSQVPAALADIQRRLVSYYGLDAIPAVEGFVSAREDVERERLLVRDAGDAVELTLELPAYAVEHGPMSLDALMKGCCHLTRRMWARCTTWPILISMPAIRRPPRTASDARCPCGPIIQALGWVWA